MNWLLLLAMVGLGVFTALLAVSMLLLLLKTATVTKRERLIVKLNFLGVKLTLKTKRRSVLRP